MIARLATGRDDSHPGSTARTSVGDRSGKPKQIRLLSCKACQSRFSERKGTPLFPAGLPPETAVSVLPHWAEGNGVRPTERLTGVPRDTVLRRTRRAGGPAKDVPNDLMVFPPETRVVPRDEKGSFIAKKQPNGDPTDPAEDHQGDGWDQGASDPEPRLVLAVVPGARSIENAAAMVQEVPDRRTGARTCCSPATRPRPTRRRSTTSPASTNR